MRNKQSFVAAGLQRESPLKQQSNNVPSRLRRLSNAVISSNVVRVVVDPLFSVQACNALKH